MSTKSKKKRTPHTEEGPTLDALLRRLAACPEEFLRPPRVRRSGEIHSGALVVDLLIDLGGDPLAAEPDPAFVPRDARDRNRLRLVQVCCWLLFDPWFAGHGGLADAAARFLARGLTPLARLVDAELFVGDGERREELCRLILAALGLRPEGERPEDAADRLRALSSVERDRVMRESKAQVERARKLREELRRKQQEEAAARWGRE